MGISNDTGNKLNTRRIAFVGVLSAVYVILSLLSIGTNDFKISIETLVILIGAIIIGPLEGCLIGIVGEIIHQLLLYGVDATTVLWLIPYGAEGLVAGMIAAKMTSPVTSRSVMPTVIVGEVILLLLVTPVNAVTAIIQGWGNWVTILGGIPLRLAITAIRIVVYVIILPFIIKPLNRLMSADK